MMTHLNGLVVQYIICSEFSFSQILVDPKIDERVELASIICMYASNEVESSVESTSYFRKTYEYFKDYGAENIFMELYSLKTQFLIDPNLLIPDALTWKLQNGEITYSMESSEQKSELQKRLNKDDYINLINQINLFYKNTNFHTFFISNTKIYEEAIAVFNTDVISRFETSIFENIAGKSTESIDLYINLLVGSKTYAIPQNKSIILGGFIERFYPYNNTHVLGMSGFGSELVYPLICNLYTIMYNNNIESYRSEVDYFTLLYYNSFQSQFDKSELNPPTILQNQVTKVLA